MRRYGRRAGAARARPRAAPGVEAGERSRPEAGDHVNRLAYHALPGSLGTQPPATSWVSRSRTASASASSDAPSRGGHAIGGDMAIVASRLPPDRAITWNRGFPTV